MLQETLKLNIQQLLNLNRSQLKQELQKGLEKSAGFLRSQLSKRMLLRTVPQLHFVYDASIDNGMKLTRLINEALADSPKE